MSLLMADRGTPGDWEAEPVTVDVEHGAVTFTLDDGEQLVFGLDDLRARLRPTVATPPPLRPFRPQREEHGLAPFRWLSGLLNPERPNLGCMSNTDIDYLKEDE
jgi:hypothetical protein